MLPLAALLLATGCGGWDPPPGASGATTPPPTAQNAAPPPSAAASIPAATPGRERELRAADFVLEQGPETAGFAAEDADQSDFTRFPEQEFADCLGVPVEQVKDRSIQTAFGQTLSTPAGFSLSSTAGIVAADALANDLAIISLPTYPGCVAEFTNDILLQQLVTDLGEGSGLAVDIVKAESVPPPPGATTRISMVMSVSDSTGVLFHIYYDVIHVFKGNVEASIFANSLEPLDEGIVSAAAAQVVEKVENQ